MAAASARAGAAVSLYDLSAAALLRGSPARVGQDAGAGSGTGRAMDARLDGSISRGHSTQDSQEERRHAASIAQSHSSLSHTAAREQRCIQRRCPVSVGQHQVQHDMPWSGSFTSFVKTTFAKYLDGGQAPNPTLLRSIFTTWLYGLRYDTEDVFLQQIKESSAQWKAHSEQIAATVYNKRLIYQHKAFAQLLVFCETYSARFAYDGLSPVERDEGDPASEVRAVEGRRSSPRKRRKSASEDHDEYVVEELVRVRVDSGGNKQVSVRWEGYRKCTWEPYEWIRRQLPEMLRLLEAPVLADRSAVGREHDEARVHAFLTSYVTAYGITALYRWTTDRLAVFEHAVSLQSPPLRVTTQRLRQMLMALLS